MNKVVISVIIFLFFLNGIAQVSTSGCTLNGGMSVYGVCTGTDATNGYTTSTAGIGCTSGCNLTMYNAFGTMCNGSPFNGNCNNQASSGGHQLITTTFDLPAGCTAAIAAEFKPRAGCTNAGVDANDYIQVQGNGGTSSSPNPNTGTGSSNASVSITFTQTGGSFTIRLNANRSEEIATWTINLSGTCGTNCNGVLPISLTDFIGKVHENTIVLNWIVASELNVIYYQIEKSFDGINFNPITTVPSIAGSSGNYNLSYQAIDHEPVKGINYYRLVNTDADGSIQSSRIISVLYQVTGANELTVNINGDQVNIILPETIPSKTIVITDVSGRIIKRIVNNSENKIITFSGADLSGGLYLVGLEGEMGIPYKKLIVN